MEEKVENVKKPLYKIFINNFVGGIAWSLGATVGFGILIASLTYILSRINLVPIVGTFVGEIINFILRNNSLLAK